jgi:hypothetical protein
MASLTSEFRKRAEQTIHRYIAGLNAVVEGNQTESKMMWQIDDLYTFAYGQFVGTTIGVLTCHFDQKYHRPPSIQETKELWGLIAKHSLEVRRILEPLKQL